MPRPEPTPVTIPVSSGSASGRGSPCSHVMWRSRSRSSVSRGHRPLQDGVKRAGQQAGHAFTFKVDEDGAGGAAPRGESILNAAGVALVAGDVKRLTRVGEPHRPGHRARSRHPRPRVREVVGRDVLPRRRLGVVQAMRLAAAPPERRVTRHRAVHHPAGHKRAPSGGLVGAATDIAMALAICDRSASSSSMPAFHLPDRCIVMVRVTSGSTAKRSPRSTFRDPSPAFAVLRNNAYSRGLSRQCQQTPC